VLDDKSPSPLTRHIKQVFDPSNILNPGKLFPEAA
jgi:FAD/FMN-containing dehydrogenase